MSPMTDTTPQLLQLLRAASHVTHDRDARALSITQARRTEEQRIAAEASDEIVTDESFVHTEFMWIDACLDYDYCL